MITDSIPKLQELHKTVSGLRAVSCRMHHEEVVQTTHASHLSSEETSSSALQFERRGFCPHDFRSRQLACGHTTARYILHDALQELKNAQSANNTEITEALQEWSNLDGSIGRLDHRKGEAEKIRAELEHQTCTSNPEFNTMEEIEGEIEEIGCTHKEYVERLENMRTNVLLWIEEVLEELGSQESGSQELGSQELGTRVFKKVCQSLLYQKED